jgi:hypothetical protein
MGSYGSESNGSCSQTYQASITGMWLVDGVCVVITELVNNLSDSNVVSGSKVLSDGVFKSSCVIKVSHENRKTEDAGYVNTYSYAPALRLSYSLSVKALCMLVSMAVECRFWRLMRIQEPTCVEE